MEDPPRKFFRLAPGREVRLRYAFFLTCLEAVKGEDGEVVALRCRYDPETRGGSAPDGRKVKATIHWVSAAHAERAPVRLYGPLFACDEPAGLEDLNPDSLEVLEDCRLEPGLAGMEPGRPVQFERLGYFAADPEGGFNRTIGPPRRLGPHQGAGGQGSALRDSRAASSVFAMSSSLCTNER